MNYFIEDSEIAAIIAAGEAVSVTRRIDGRDYSLRFTFQENTRVLLITDVTEAMAAARSKNDFIANVTHEMNTPLTNIRGFAELIESGSLPPERVTSAAAHMDGTADDAVRADLIQQQAHGGDVGDGVHRPHLVEVDLVHGSAVDGAFGFGDDLIDRQHVLLHLVLDGHGRHHGADIGHGAVVMVMAVLVVVMMMVMVVVMVMIVVMRMVMMMVMVMLMFVAVLMVMMMLMRMLMRMDMVVGMGVARVSAVPGKTATINFFRLENVRFADLPGYGYAKVSQSEKQRWSDLIETYFNSDRRIGLVFQLIDMRHPPTRDDLMMVDFLIECELPFVVVLTKKDKLSKKQQEERLAALQQELPYADQIHIVPFSAVKGDGVEELREIIDEIAEENKE